MQEVLRQGSIAHAQQSCCCCHGGQGFFCSFADICRIAIFTQPETASRASSASQEGSRRLSACRFDKL